MGRGFDKVLPDDKRIIVVTGRKEKGDTNRKKDNGKKTWFPDIHMLIGKTNQNNWPQEITKFIL